MEIKQILGNIGVTALGTIAPPFGGMAANILKKTLGLKEDSTDQQIKDAIKNATPEQVVELKKAEQDFKVKLKELDVDILELDQRDRDNAREMQAKTKSNVPAFLSASITIGFFGVLYTMIYKGVPVGDRDALLVMLGSLGTAWTGVVSYWFGSSQGSKDKTEIMGKK